MRERVEPKLGTNTNYWSEHNCDSGSENNNSKARMGVNARKAIKKIT